MWMVPMIAAVGWIGIFLLWGLLRLRNPFPNVVVSYKVGSGAGIMIRDVVSGWTTVGAGCVDGC